jgi:hypothetical protein
MVMNSPPQFLDGWHCPLLSTLHHFVLSWAAVILVSWEYKFSTTVTLALYTFLFALSTVKTFSKELHCSHWSSSVASRQSSDHLIICWAGATLWTLGVVNVFWWHWTMLQCQSFCGLRNLLSKWLCH